MCLVCFCIAKLATDPSGLSLIMNELAMSDEQLSRLQVVPLTQYSTDRMQGWETCLAGTAEAFSKEITAASTHQRRRARTRES